MEHWREAWLRVFSGRHVVDGLFRDDNRWQMALVPHGLEMSRDAFEPMAAAARVCGDETAMISPMDAGRPDVPVQIPSFEVKWHWEALETVTATSARTLPSWMWGASARWGLVSEGRMHASAVHPSL